MSTLEEEPAGGDAMPAEAGGEVAEGARGSRSWLRIVAIVATVLVALALLGAAWNAAQPAVVRGVLRVTGWDERLATDYPGWKPVGAHVQWFLGPDGAELTYFITLVPPNRDFSVGVVYTSKPGSSPVAQESVLRTGRQADAARAKALLDYVELAYADKGYSIRTITSDSEGHATVDRAKVSRFGPFMSTVGSAETLTYDKTAGRYSIASYNEETAIDTMVSTDEEDDRDPKDKLLFDHGFAALKQSIGEPTAAFTVAFNPDLPIDDWVELSDGDTYHFIWGFDRRGKARVYAHAVEVLADLEFDERDRSFIQRFEDGVTPVKELNAYFAKQSPDWVKIDPDGPEVKALSRVPAYYWRLPDGGGYVVRDLSGLTEVQRVKFGLAPTDPPYDSYLWDAGHRHWTYGPPSPGTQ